MPRTRRSVLLACLAVLVVAAPVTAATITVTTTTDENNADGDCALREAVIAANTNVAVDQCTAGSNTETDTIVVPAGTYTLTLTNDVNDNALGGDLDLLNNLADEDVVIDGAGAGVTIIQSCQVNQKTATCPAGQGVVERVFQNTADAHATIRDVTIRNGRDTTGNGGGVWNRSGVLTIRNCELTDNFEPSGFDAGAIFSSAGSGKSATLNVVDSTLTRNAAGRGGGIEIEFGDVNIGSQLNVTGSTISDNVSSGSAGGIMNRGGAVVITNSTISGNAATAGGGGIISQDNSVTTHASLALRSSTVTANTVTQSGQHGGGVTVGQNSTATLRNTIIAGNVDPAASQKAPDCLGSFMSEGYNLVGNGVRCTIELGGGDQIGTDAAPIDAKLGALAQNGGPTATHLPAADSPAANAGNPATPGSGGLACPSTDQRGETRQVGCDTGAVEFIGGTSGPVPLALVSVKPVRAGSGLAGNGAGISSFVLVYGNGIADGATVKLTRSGQPDIVGANPTRAPSGAPIGALLNLAAAAPGVWNVVVTNPDQTSDTLPDAFTIEPGGVAKLWVKMLLPTAFVFGRSSLALVLFGNRGTLDAYGVPITFSIPDDLEFHVQSAIAAPPSQPGQIATDWSTQAIDVAVPPPADLDTFPLLVSVVPANSTRMVLVRLKTPVNVDPARRPFPFTYAIGKPSFAPALSPTTVAFFVTHGKQYATTALGATTLPSDAAIEQYVRTQLAGVLHAGEAALTAQVGVNPPVFSVTQLVVDVAQFIAGKSEASLAALDSHDGLTRFAQCAIDALALVADVDARVVDPDCDPGDAFCERKPDCFNQPPVGRCAPDPVTKQCDPQPYIFDDCIPIPGGDGNGGGGSDTSDISSSRDPNDKIGPSGLGGFTDGLTPIPYAVLFENKSDAGAAALEVAITDQLDLATLDVATFSLGAMRFGTTDVLPPPGLTAFTTDVDLRPGRNLLVRIAAGLDAGTGVVSWHFTTLDPATGEIPADPLDGFLPPNVTPPEGEGFVQFTVSPKTSLALGTSICNDARIVFDFNAPIDTPEWCNVIGTPEDCGNCADDDGDGKVDRADTDCLPAPADGGGAGVGNPAAAKALDKCAKAVRKVGGKLGATHAKLVSACLKAVGDCVQLKPGDAKCLTGAVGKCAKAKASLQTADAKGDAALTKACGPVAPGDLAAVTGIGFTGEAAICAARGVAGVATLDDVSACVRLQHGCAADHRIAAAVPRAGELLALGSWNSVTEHACIDQNVNGGGAAIAADKRKALRKCDLAMQKAATALAAGRTKALQACGAAAFTCVQAKPGDASCLTKAGAACTKAVGGLAKLGGKFTAAIAKACGAAPLVPADLLAPEGLGIGGLAESCAALGVPALASVADVSSCLARQVACRVDQAIRNETPRLDELLTAGGVTLP